MDLTPDQQSRLHNVPIVPGGSATDESRAASREIWAHLLLLAIAAASGLAIYTEVATRLFFSFDRARQKGDPCLTFIRPTAGPDTSAVWSNFGHCPAMPRDTDREMVSIDLRYGMFSHYKTEAIMEGLPFPFTRVVRNRDDWSRAFGKGGTHMYDMGLVGDAAGFTYVEVVLPGGGRIHYRPMSQWGWFESSVSGYFGDTTLQWTGRDWRLRRDDGTELVFPESSRATRLEQGALLEIRGESEDVPLAIDRDRLGNILHLRTGSDRADFEHDAHNRITAISNASAGPRLRFEYDATGCLARQTGSGTEFGYEYLQGGKTCQLQRSRQDGVTSFEAEYDNADRVVRVTDPAGRAYDFSYETNGEGDIVGAEVHEPDGTIRRITLDEDGFWFSRWGANREP